MAQIYLIRHGQANRTGENYDVLSDLGKLQSTRLGEYFREWQIHPDKAVAGSLNRQQDTGSHFLNSLGTPDLELEMDSGWNEFSPDLWKSVALHIAKTDASFSRKLHEYSNIRRSGSRKATALFFQITTRVLSDWRDQRIEVEGVETFQDFRNRVTSSIYKLLDSKAKDICVFSSGAPISLLLSTILEWPIHRSFEWMPWIWNTSLTQIHVKKRDLSLRTINSLPHLRALEEQSIF